MSDARLFQTLHEEIQVPNDSDRRAIIRFKSRDDFTRWLRLREKLIPDLPRLAYVRPLAMIHAFSCPLPCAETGAAFPAVAGIEWDRKEAAVHGLPDIRRSATIKPSGDSPYIPWGVSHIKAPQTWSRTTGNRVRVAVIDTGIDYNHPDLQHAVENGINLINRHSLPVDDNGHGTHIAGTIAAYAQNGITGVAPQASIHPVKAFDEDGTAYVSDIIYGIYWCLRNRIDVVNMSFGMKHHSRALEDAVRTAYYSGMIIVASSGNDGRTSRIDYPARFPHTLSVGATNKKSQIASFSNKSKYIDIYAPGEKIVSTWLRGEYQELSGTSMATSHVSGVVALLLSANRKLTPRKIKSIIRRNASRMTSKRLSSDTGELNAYRSVKSSL
ncbi:S8 family peptidase [Paenibacillus sp. MBLB4367]|uniref:S8 family peptidase n=1 Tax=Paenibacillus sp. MBLB4367 TaxID=3384767 RepID=UPI00390820BF